MSRNHYGDIEFPEFTLVKENMYVGNLSDSEPSENDG